MWSPNNCTCIVFLLLLQITFSIIIMLFDFGHAGETVISVFQLWKALSAFVLIITFWRLLFCRNFEVWDKFWDKSFPIPPLHFLTEESRGSKRKVLIEKRLTSVRAKEIYKGVGLRERKAKRSDIAMPEKTAMHCIFSRDGFFQSNM